MKNKLVFIPVCYKENYSMSANVKMDNYKAAELYLKNALVALKSVSNYNPNVSVAIVTNFKLWEPYASLFKSHNIDVYETQFNNYVLPPDFTWSLAFFKIAAIKYILENTDYDYILEMETDEICINNFDDMWKELDSKLLTATSSFRYNHPSRVLYSEIYRNMYPNELERMIPKTGAGFIAANRANMAHFISYCDVVYEYLNANKENISKNLGDELYTSLYCAVYPERFISANPYVAVYWTGSFYFVSTNYKFDAIAIVHVPSEKAMGMITLFDYLLKKEKLPENEKIFQILRFPPAKHSFRNLLFTMHQRIKRKLL